MPISQETYVRAYPELPENHTYISYGLPFPQSCAKHISETFKAKRIYIIASPSLAKCTDGLDRLKEVLGEKVVGVRMGIPAHTPLDAVMEIIGDVREKGVDCVVTLGGGSIIDGAKAVILGLANNIPTFPSLERFVETNDCSQGMDSSTNMAPPTLPIICIPTTLSGGEYSRYIGTHHPLTKRKYLLAHPLAAPSLIILDPSITLTTPRKTWISSGVRAIDHCCESVANIDHDGGYDEKFCETLREIAAGLLASGSRDGGAEDELVGRFKCQLAGAWSMIWLELKIWVGASHGIGHMLGPLGVGHGETSCILSPAVMKYNASPHTTIPKDQKTKILTQQSKIKTALWTEPSIKAILTKHGLKEESSDVSDALDKLFRELGMPRSLKEVGVERDRFEWLAEMSLLDVFTRANPVAIERKEQVLEILEMVAGD